MLRLREISKGLMDAVHGICSMTYLQDRPSAVDEKVSDYLVVALPVSFRNVEMDGNGAYDAWETTVNFTLFVRDRRTAANPNSIRINLLDERLLALQEKFPIKIPGLLKASRPRILVSSEDGNGFHYCIVQADLTTMVNA